MAEAVEQTAQEVWSAGQGLSKRVKRLRDEYFSFDSRDHFRNEVRPYTTGLEGDILFAPHAWGVAPEVFIFSKSIQDTLTALATKVELPQGFWDKPIAQRQALFFAEVISKYLPVKILEGELIVGAQFNAALSKTLNNSEMKAWHKLEKKYIWANRFLNLFGIGNTGAIPGHLIPDYPKVLAIGFSGLVAEFEEIKKEAPPEHSEYLDALIIAASAVKEFSARYADLAAETAEAETDPERKAELKDIAEVCRQVPWNPPQSFHQAVQALWFTHMLVMTSESYPGPGLSPGRIDQYLYPFYQKDIDSGAITREWAAELLRCYFIKHNYAYDFMGRVGTNQGINSGFGQLITLSGTGPEGQDMSNDLTWLFIDIIEEMNMLEPKPNIRLHHNSPDRMLERVVDMVGTAQGAPFLLNFDEISMKALGWAGMPEDQLWDYAPVGCLENTMQGCERAGTVDVNLNFAKPVEMVMSRGRDLKLKWRLGPHTGNPAKFKTFDEFFTAYKIQLTALIDRILDVTIMADRIRSRFEPVPYLSALIQGCAESGKDVTAGGPRYNFITVEGIAFATAVDSLAAVKKLVYDEEKVSIKDLLKALKSNFKNNESLRQMLMHQAPKYGNDDPEADEIARQLNKFFSEEVFKRTSPVTGRRFRAGYLSWNYWILYAGATAATPDGRPRGTYLSNGICPVTGVDRKGPVSMARSVYNVGLTSVPNGASHTMSFNPSLVRTAEGKKKMAAFLRGYGIQGGSALQINMISPETLRNAQNDPQKYGNLLVRVTGYNAYFTTLGRELQNEIIDREAFRIEGQS